MIHTYEVKGMHCQSCVGKVTSGLRALPQIRSAEVTLEPPSAKVEMTQHVSTQTLNRELAKVGDYRLLGEGEVDAISETKKESLYPLFLIVGYIAGAVAVVALSTGNHSLQDAMRYFMAGFFLVFSFFKLLDLRGFADAFRGYDILARALPFWAFFYPFVELTLGVAYLANAFPFATNVATLIVMLVGAVGVLKSLLNKTAIRCACLGTALNLPMTTITLVEDLGMAAMAGLMLVMHFM